MSDDEAQWQAKAVELLTEWLTEHQRYLDVIQELCSCARCEQTRALLTGEGIK